MTDKEVIDKVIENGCQWCGFREGLDQNRLDKIINHVSDIHYKGIETTACKDCEYVDRYPEKMLEHIREHHHMEPEDVIVDKYDISNVI